MESGQEKLEEILAEAIALTDPAARASYLAKACLGDAALRSKVEALIAAYEERGEAVEKTLAVRPGLAQEGPGAVIGRYKLLQEIGEGGFGVVFMAEQLEPVQRKVALKIIKAGMDTREVIARFEAERQALALMDHPNIARVLDAGATESGRPYFVMELVKGVRITDYCDQNDLSTQERLNLFINVCHAVQHAHQKGVIHRDLKPSNVMVTLHDGEAVPKVIDFGIAKATGQRLTEKTLFTRYEQMIGTPAYMSPEQAAMSGLDIDTRTDIYALGVLLYELLTGVTPFDKETLAKAALDEIRRMIRETEPPKPSTRLHSMGEKLAEVAKHRHTEPGGLQRSVRGDLDWIVMRALEKDRRRRYETANNLAEDLERHLEHQPVLASPPGALYRARKFVRRHRLGVAFAAAVVLALATGLSLFAWMFLREKEARERVEVRAYFADMGAALRVAAANVGGVEKLLAPWQNHRTDLRSWEWYYLDGLCHQDVLTIRADTNELWSVAWSPDGTRLATGGAEGAIKIWDALNGRQLACLRGHTGEVRAVRWSPDGRHLASASMDTTVKIWAVANAREIATLRGHTNDVFCVAWSPDGARLASGSRDHTVRIWDSVSGANTQTLLAQRTVLSLSWTSDGTRLAAAGFREMVKVWDLPSGKELWGDEVPGSSNPMFCVWSPDGKRLATGGNRWTGNIRDATTGRIIFKQLGRGGPFGSIAWAPRGPWLASSLSQRGIIAVWDTTTGREVKSFVAHAGAIRCLCWRPDGSRIASAGLDGTVRIWDTTRLGLSVTSLEQRGRVTALAWHPDGSKLAVGSETTSARILDLTHATGPIVLPGETIGTRAVAWNPAGTRLACGGNDGGLRVWDAVKRTEIWHAQLDTNALTSVAWSPDSQRLASARTLLDVRDAATGKQLPTFAPRSGAYRELAWSPEGNYLAVAIHKDLQILDSVSGRERHFLKGHADTVESIAWSPDGKQLASAAADASVKIWDVASGRETQTLLGHAGPVGSVAWHPDGTRLVSAGLRDYTLIFWEPASGLAICSPSAEPFGGSWAAWSPDGTRLAVWTLAGMIRILDSTPGRQVQNQVAE